MEAPRQYFRPNLRYLRLPTSCQSCGNGRTADQQRCEVEELETSVSDVFRFEGFLRENRAFYTSQFGGACCHPASAIMAAKPNASLERGSNFLGFARWHWRQPRVWFCSPEGPELRVLLLSTLGHTSRAPKSHAMRGAPPDALDSKTWLETLHLYLGRCLHWCC